MTRLSLDRFLGGQSGDHAHSSLTDLSDSGKVTTLALISPGADDDVLGRDGWSDRGAAITVQLCTENLEPEHDFVDCTLDRLAASS